MMGMRILFAAPLFALAISSAYAQQRQPANVSTLPTTSPQEFDLLDKTGKWLPFGTGSNGWWRGAGAAIEVDQFGAKGDFVNDDGPAIAAAINAAATTGGTVLLAAHPYWNRTQTLTIPANVTLACASDFVKYSPTYDFTAMPCTIYQAAAAGTITWYGTITNVGVLQDRLHFLPQTTRAQMQAYVSGFTGTGITAGAAGGDESGTAAIMQNVLIGGFATCINYNGAYQTQIRQVLGDCTNGLYLTNSHDDNFLDDVEFWAFTTTHKPQAQNKWTITNIADNGSGAWRVTFTANTNDPPVNGETLGVAPNVGGIVVPGFTPPNPTAAGAGGLWTVTNATATTVDLVGSNSTPTTTGNTINGVSYITVASTDNLANGMNVSGAGISTGAKIGAVWRTRKAISLDQSHPATATATGVALSFTSDPFVGDTSSKLFYNANYRMGTGFYVGNEEGTNCSHCYAFGYQIAFDFNQAVFSSFTNSEDDGVQDLLSNQNYVSVGVRFTNASYANTWQGSANTSSGVHIWNDTGFVNGVGNVISASFPATSTHGSTFLEHASGGLVFRDMAVQVQGAILIDHTAWPPVFFGINAPQAIIYDTQSSPHFFGSANTFGGLPGWQNPVFVKGQALYAAAPAGASVNLYDGSQALDAKYWRVFNGGGSMCLQTADDAYTTATNAWCAFRSANSATKMLMSTPLGFASYAIAALPTCTSSLVGTVAYVTNGQASPPYLGAVSTTGAVVAPVFCNGSGWVYH